MILCNTNVYPEENRIFIKFYEAFSDRFYRYVHYLHYEHSVIMPLCPLCHNVIVLITAIMTIMSIIFASSKMSRRLTEIKVSVSGNRYEFPETECLESLLLSWTLI